MTKLFKIFKFFFLPLTIYANHSLLFVHKGPSLPPHVEVCLFQARLMNPDTPIYFIANQNAIDRFSPDDQNMNIEFVPIESLPRSQEHKRWISNGIRRDWRVCSERFFFIDEFLRESKLENVFHMEHDNMLYVDLNTLMPIFDRHYPGIAITMDNDEHCVCGFMFIKNSDVAKKLATFFSYTAHLDLSDMQTPVYFRRTYPRLARSLPIIPQTYAENFDQLKSRDGHIAQSVQTYHNLIHEFNSVFDAAALGQFLCGTHVYLGPGFINERAIFNPAHFKYQWRLDEKNRRIPYLIYKDKEYRINNLHVHSKNLSCYCSSLEGPYTLGYLPSRH